MDVLGGPAGPAGPGPRPTRAVAAQRIRVTSRELTAGRRFDQLSPVRAYTAAVASAIASRAGTHGAALLRQITLSGIERGLDRTAAAVLAAQRIDYPAGPGRELLITDLGGELRRLLSAPPDLASLVVRFDLSIPALEPMDGWIADQQHLLGVIPWLSDVGTAAEIPREGARFLDAPDQLAARWGHMPGFARLLQAVALWGANPKVVEEGIAFIDSGGTPGLTRGPDGRTVDVGRLSAALLVACARAEHRAPELHSGIAVAGDLSSVARRYRSGEALHCSIAAFSEDVGLAQEVARSKRAAGQPTPVIFHVARGSRGFNTYAVSHRINHREWLERGAFLITEVGVHNHAVHVGLRQVEPEQSAEAA